MKINLAPFKASNTRLLIEEEAKRLNNYLDCDVIQEAMTKVVAPNTSREEVLEAINYLVSAVDYRGGSTKLLEQYLEDYRACIV